VKVGDEPVSVVLGKGHECAAHENVFDLELVLLLCVGRMVIIILTSKIDIPFRPNVPTLSIDQLFPLLVHKDYILI
jgi:hypothetical protein